MVGVASVAALYLIVRRRGRNEVFAGGAADTAYGAAPTPGSALSWVSAAPAEVRLVADERLDALATTEFIPPEGIEPWQGTVLLREHIDDNSIGAWFSGLVARDVITLARDSHGDVTLGVGKNFDSAPPEDRDLLSTMFDWRQRIHLGSYDKRFATAWRKVRVEQKRAIARSGWWKRRTPAGGAGLDALWRYVFVSGLSVLVVFGGALAAVGWIDTAPAASPARPGRPGDRRLRPLPFAAPGAQRPRLGTGPTGRVVPPLPQGERGTPRRMGMEAGTAAPVLGVGGGARCRRRVATGDKGSGRATGRAFHRSAAHPQHRAVVESHVTATSHHSVGSGSATGVGSGAAGRWRVLRHQRRRGGGGGSSGSW